MWDDDRHRSGSGHRRRRCVAPRLIALALTVHCSWAQAQWTNEPAPAHDEGGTERAAVTSNDEGHRLIVFMPDAERLVGVLRLPVGLLAFDEAGCPSLGVDDQPAEALHLPSGRCRVAGAEARIDLAQVNGGQVDSGIVLQLLNGDELTVRYRLRDAGYRETRFSLKGSKQALLATLPQGTVIVGD